MNLFQIVDGNGDLETHDAADKFENLTINTDPIAEDSKVRQDISGRNGFQEGLSKRGGMVMGRLSRKGGVVFERMEEGFELGKSLKIGTGAVQLKLGNFFFKF